MEKHHASVHHHQLVDQSPSRMFRAPDSRCYLGVILFLGLFSISLLIGLLILNKQYTHSNSDLTKHLQSSHEKLFSRTEERDQLEAKLTKTTEELSLVKDRKSSDIDSKQDVTGELSTVKANNKQPSSDLLDRWLNWFNDTSGKIHQVMSFIINSDSCPDGWTMFSTSCYLISTSSGSWTESRESCRNEGADLVVIDDHAEQIFIDQLNISDVWIGLTDAETEGSWTWVDGSPLNYTNWAPEQPDDFGDEDCAHLRSHYKTWNDVPCTDYMEWICEKEATRA